MATVRWPGAQGYWQGAGRPTSFISETELRLTLTGLDLAFPGYGSITVVNPEPGGGESNAVRFSIVPYALFLPLVIQ